MLGNERLGQLRFVCSDMGKPYLKVIGKKAVHVLDRFHIMAKMNKAIGGDCRGPEQQSKTDDEKSVRLSDCESH